MIRDLDIQATTKDSLLYSLGIISLYGYVFYSDFVVAMMHISYFKPITALLAFLCMAMYIASNFNRLRLNPFFIAALLFLGVYAIVFRNMGNLNYFYTTVFAFFLIQIPKKSLKALDVVFYTQLFFVAIEFLTRQNLYTTVTTGLFSSVEMEVNTETFDNTGFRAKGLFGGILIATCFVINYSLIHCNNYKKSLLSLLMAVMIGGRLAILITGVIFLYNLYIKRSKGATRVNIPAIIGILFIVLFAGSILITFASSVSVSHFLSVFDMDSDSNAGRLFRYGLAVDAFANYSLIEKMTGGEFELFDEFQRLVPPESEVLGILLEFGLIGALYIYTPIIYAWKTTKEPLLALDRVSNKFILLLSLASIIEYRHIVGNVRGMMFWLLIMIIVTNNKNQK